MLKYFSRENGFKESLKIIKKNKNKKICYISLDRTYEKLAKDFKKEKMNIKNFYIIDCISAVLKKPEKQIKNCDFISAQYELKGISNSIKKAIKQDYDLIIFNSLSNLFVFGQVVPAGVNSLINFINSFSKDLGEGKAIFLCRIEDKKNFLLEETLPIFDKVGK